MIDQTEQEAVLKWLQTLEKLASARGFENVRWGESAGLPLLAFQRPSGGAPRVPGPPRIYLSAGIHGDEPAGPHAIEDLLRHERLSPDVSWTICPLLNPWGWGAGTRENSRGIDLNRDYLTKESSEAVAHSAWIDRVGCHDLYLSLHEDWEASGFYLYEINTSAHLPFAARILEEVAKVMRIEPLHCIDDHLVCAPGYIAHPPVPDEPRNWPEAIYHCKRYPHLSYTFETPSSLPLQERVLALVTAVEAATTAFLSGWR